MGARGEPVLVGGTVPVLAVLAENGAEALPTLEPLHDNEPTLLPLLSPVALGDALQLPDALAQPVAVLCAEGKDDNDTEGGAEGESGGDSDALPLIVPALPLNEAPQLLVRDPPTVAVPTVAVPLSDTDPAPLREAAKAEPVADAVGDFT